MTNLKCCCSSFDFYISEIGKKGFSVLIDKMPTGQLYFIQQGRSHNYDDKTNNSHVIFQRVINYCPSCGYKLSDLIDDNKSQINELYQRNKYLLL